MHTSELKDSHLAWPFDDYLIFRLLKRSFPHFPSLDLHDDCVLIDSFAFSNTCGKLTKIQEVVHVMFQRGVAEGQGTPCGPPCSSCS